MIQRYKARSEVFTQSSHPVNKTVKRSRRPELRAGLGNPSKLTSPSPNSQLFEDQHEGFTGLLCTKVARVYPTFVKVQHLSALHRIHVGLRGQTQASCHKLVVMLVVFVAVTVENGV